MKKEAITKLFYEKGKLLTFEEAKEKALLFFEYMKLTDEDLCDYWYGLADNWDVNIWLDVDDEDYEDENEKFFNVTLYEVVDGNTTDNFTRIYPLT